MRIMFHGPGLQESTHECSKAMIRACGHEAVDHVAIEQEMPDIYLVTCFGLTAHDYVPFRMVPTVRWWVGTDIVKLEEGHTRPHADGPLWNWCTNAMQQRRLSKAGVEARIIAHLPVMEPEWLEWPEQDVVLTYVPNGMDRRYMWDSVLAVAKCLPDVSFRVLRRSGESPLANMELLGAPHRDFTWMKEQYRGCKAFLRLVTYDGCSLTVQEALGFGRHVLWTLPFDVRGCHHVLSAAETVEVLARVLQLPQPENIRFIEQHRVHTLIAMKRAIEEIAEWTHARL